MRSAEVKMASIPPPPVPEELDDDDWDTGADPVFGEPTVRTEKETPPPPPAPALKLEDVLSTPKNLASRPSFKQRKKRRSSKAYSRVAEATLDDVAQASIAIVKQEATSSTAGDYASAVRTQSMSHAEQRYYWIHHSTSGYAAVEKLDDGSFESLERGLDVPSRVQIYAPLPRLEALKQEYENMVHMDDVNEASILHNLKLRFKEDRFMTNVGNILISLNPFKDLDYLYTMEVVLQYHRWKLGDLELPPHIYQIADRAYKGVKDDMKAQAIIISGESGAGKTVATKKCLQYFAEVAGSGSGMSDKILSANPILEAFGNAKTVRNNNSSRFGKWIEIYFSGSMAQISGAKITSYLLEKPRLVRQGATERNYHVFYQIFHDSSWRAKLKLTVMSDYKLINQSGCTKVQGLNDAEEFEDMLFALDQCGFSKEQESSIFEIIGAILHLGNIEFEDDVDGTGYAGVLRTEAVSHAVTCAANLLQIDASKLRKNLCIKELCIRGEKTVKTLDSSASAALRDSLIKSLYGQLFNWLVSGINDSLEGTTARGKSGLVSVGVLDIFGFEIFEYNSFEQLCINFANEKLQQNFNRATFKDEQALYMREGLDIPTISFEDNQDLIETVESTDKKRPGLLVMLDEELSLIGAGSDVNFLKKTAKLHSDNPRIHLKGRSRADSGLRDTEFWIHHYAGKVKYDVAGFLEKNKDELVANLQDVLKTSKLALVKNVLFKEETIVGNQSVRGPRGAARSKKESQGRQFRKQLNALMVTLDKAIPHYVRTIKSNQAKKPNTLDAMTTLEQLRYSGIFEAVSIRKQGYPFRLPHAYFFQRYFFLQPRQTGGRRVSLSGKNVKEKCEALVTYVSSQHEVISQCRLGKSMVFYRPEQYVILEVLRERHARIAVCFLQRVALGFLGRCKAKKVKTAWHQLQISMEQKDPRELETTMADITARGLQWIFIFRAAEKRLEYLFDVAKVNAALVHISSLDPVHNFDEMKDVLDTAKKLNMNTPELSKARERLEDVRELIETKRDLCEGFETTNKDMLVSALIRAEKLQESKPEFCKEEVKRAKEALQEISEEEKRIARLIEAIESGCLGQSGDAINVSTVRTQNLQTAINVVNEKRLKTSQGLRVLKTATSLLETRRLVMSADWESIAALIKDLDFDDLFDGAKKEFALVKNELKDREAMKILSALLESYPVVGTVGALDTDLCDVLAMDRHIETVKTLGKLRQETNVFFENCLKMYELRKAVITHDWDAVGKLFAELHAHKALKTLNYGNSVLSEYHLILSEFTNRSIIRTMSPALSNNCVKGEISNLDISNVSVFGIDKALAMVKDDVEMIEAAKLLIFTGKIIRTARLGVVSSDWDTVESVINASYHVNKHMYANVAHTEMALILDESINRKILGQLQRGVRVGKISGIVGNIAFDLIEVEALNKAIHSATDLGCKASSTIRLLSGCQKLISLRRLFIDRSWDEASSLLRSLDTREMPELFREELELAKKECDDQHILGTLWDALASGDLGGEIGEGAFDLINVASIESALKLANSMGTRSSASAKRKNCAELILRVRLALKAENWLEIDNALKDVKNYSIESICTAEIERARDEYGNWKTISLCSKAAATGSVKGNTEKPNLDSVSVRELKQALFEIEGIDQKTQKSSQWVQTCSSLIRLRSLLISGDFTALEYEIESLDINTLSEHVLPEVNLIVDIVHNELALKRMHHALTTGSIKGTVGNIQVESIHYVDLETTVKRVENNGTRTVLAAAVLRSAKNVFLARKALKQDNMVNLKSFVDGLHEESVVGFEMANDELNLAKRECIDRSVLHRLRGAISRGQIRALNGVANMEAIIVQDLFEAISFSQKFLLENRSTISLVSASELLLSIRRSVRDVDYNLLKTSLRRFENEVEIVPEMYEEILVARDLYNDYVILQSLKAALRTGMARGNIGQIDLACIELEALDEAITRVSELQCKTFEAKQWFESAQTVHRIRVALKFMDWNALEDIIKNMHFVSVVDEVKPEIHLAQNEIHNRIVILSLKEALSNGSIRGEIGSIDLEHVALANLNISLVNAERLGCKTVEAKLLRTTASFMLKVREAVVNGEWSVVDEVLVDMKKEDISAIVSMEVQLIEEESKNRTIIMEVATALSMGAIAGVPGNIETSGVDANVMEDAILRVKQIGPRSEESLQMLRTAEFIFELRKLVLSGLWDSVYSHIHEHIYDGNLHPVSMAVDEIELSYREAIDVSVTEHLSSAMTRGRLVFVNGNFDLAKVAVRLLESAILFADSSGCSGAKALRLLDSAKFLISCRKALLDESFAILQTILDTCDANKLDECVLDEFEALKSYSINIEVNASLRKVLAESKVEGIAGDVIFPESFDSLANAIYKTAKHVEVLTSENKVWYEWARFMNTIRHQSATSQWESVQELIENCSPGESITDFEEEVSLLLAEAKNRAMVVELSDALTQDMAVGTVDEIDVSTVSINPLLAAIEKAEKQESLTPAAKLLHASAEFVLRLRQALLSGPNWDDIRAIMVKLNGGSIANIVDDEINFVAKAAENQLVVSVLTAALLEGALEEPPSADDFDYVNYQGIDDALALAHKFPCESETIKNLISMATFTRRIRAAIKDGFWDAVDAIIVDSKHLQELFTPRMWVEMELASNIVKHRKVIACLREGIGIGAAKGDVGNVVYDLVSVKELDSAITQAKEIRCVTEESQRLLAAAETLHELRIQLKAKDWPFLQRVLQGAYEAGFYDILREELQVIRDECENALICGQLLESLSEGVPIGTVGHLDLNALDHGELLAAISNAEAIVPKTDRAQTLMKTAQVVVQLRRMIKNKNYPEAHDTLTHVELESLAIESHDEIKCYKDEVSNFLIIRDLRDALMTGMAVRSQNKLDTATVRVKQLDTAVSQARLIKLKSDEAKLYFQNAEVVLSMREGLQTNDWDVIDDALMRSRSIVICEEADAEIKSVQDLKDDRSIVIDLTAAMSSGFATGSIGNKHTDSIDLVTLDTAIAFATKLGCKTREANQLLQNAKLIRQIRLAWRVYEHDGVADLRTVLEKIDAVNDFEPVPVTLDEIQAARDEVNNHDICKNLEHGLQNGKVRGEVGQINTADVVTEVLANSIAESVRLQCKTNTAKTLQQTAKLIRGVRGDILHDDWVSVEARLLSLETKSAIDIHPSAKAELQLIKLEVDDRKACEALSSALERSSKIPGCIDSLKHAIELAKDLNSKSIKAGRLLSAATFILDLREFVSKEDWTRVGQILTGVSMHLLPESVQPEVMRLRSDLLEVTAKSKLTQALCSGGLTNDDFGSLDHSHVRTDELDTAIRFVRAMKCESHDILDLEKVAIAVRRMRKSIIDHDHENVAKALQNVQYVSSGTKVLTFIQEEIDVMEEIVRNRCVANNIRTALQTGSGDGEPGSLITTSISVEELHVKINEVSTLQRCTNEVQWLSKVAQKVVMLREALLLGDWQTIESFSATVKTQGALTNEEQDALGVDDSEIVETELCTIVAEIEIRNAVANLRSVLTSGRPTYEGSHINMGTIDTSSIEIALEQAQAAGVRAGEGHQLMITAKFIKQLRLALLAGNWADVTTTIERLDEIEASPYAADEIENVRVYSEWHADVQEVTLGLIGAMAKKDVRELKALMARAEYLRLDSLPDMDIASIVIHSRAHLIKLEKSRADLIDSLTKTPLRMRLVLEEATKLGFDSSPEAKEVRARLQKFDILKQDSELAISTIDTELMRGCLVESESFGVSLPLSARMKEIIDLPFSQLLQLRLHVAISKGDVGEISEVTIEIKSLHFQQLPDFHYNISNFGNLRKEMIDLYENAFVFSPTPAANSITKLDHRDAVVATRLFKYIMGFMGDRHYTYPMTLATEALQTGYLHPLLRDELFLQLIKQVTNNPRQSAVEKGWQFMYLALRVFPPSESFENYLEWFLRSNNHLGSSVLVKQLHVIVYTGIDESPPSLETVRAIAEETAGLQLGKRLQ